MSHGWSGLPVFSIRPFPLTSRYIQHQQLWLPGKLSLLICYDTPPSPSLSPPPSFLFPLTLPQPPISLSLSPHPSPPLLRVSGRLFFSLMKGRTKLPSLCPCVVGKFTSPFVSFFSFHRSVAASVLHVSWKVC